MTRERASAPWCPECDATCPLHGTPAREDWNVSLNKDPHTDWGDAFRSQRECDMCGHENHHDTECGEVTGYDHLNGDHECGCPGSLATQLAQAWDEGANAAVEAYNAGTRMTLRARIPFPADENPYRKQASR